MHCFASKLEARMKQSDGDITVCTNDGRTLHAHRFILELSPVFRAELAGPMREAQTSRVNMDCGYDQASAFLRFLYVGSFSIDDFKTFPAFLDMFRLADFYAVGEECAMAVSQREFCSVLLSLWMSYVETSYQSAMKSLNVLSELSSFPKRLIASLIDALDVSLGKNLFVTLCHAHACGCLSQVLQHSRKLVWPQTPVPEWLEAELNESVLISLASEYHEKPDLLRVVLLEFIGKVFTIGRDAPSTPAWGIRHGSNMERFNAGRFESALDEDLSVTVSSIFSEGHTRSQQDASWSMSSVEAFSRRTPDLIKSVEDAIAQEAMIRATMTNPVENCFDHGAKKLALTESPVEVLEAW